MTMTGHDSSEAPKEPFVPQADRPAVRIKSDTPLSELRVRDLASLLAQVGGTGKDFWDGKDWVKDDFDGVVIKKDKEKEKEKDKEKEKAEKAEKFEKHEKFEKNEVKAEKFEAKEIKAEKVEVDGVFAPGTQPGPDPRLDQVITALTGLTAQVTQLADQVEELKRTGKG
jgi:hypothetical protein